MAFPAWSYRASRRRPCQILDQLARHREQQYRWREQWDQNARYYRDETARSQAHAAWSSQHSLKQSLSAYHFNRMKEEWKVDLERRRNRLRALLQQEQRQFELELRKIKPDRSSLVGQYIQKSEDLRSAREEQRKKVAQHLLKEHWKKNNSDLREVESALHTDHVVRWWQDQICEKKQREVSELEEKKQFENEYERTRKEALKRIRQAEVKKKEEECKRMEALREQMQELKLREEEANCLKKEEQALLAKQWELEKIEEQRRKEEERQSQSKMRHFLIHQYRAQLKRRAREVQEELENDRKLLAALMEGEEEDKKLETARREQAIADAAWMKRVIEQQLQLERDREAELEILHREEAQRQWEKQEAQWEKERKARERLMHEVLAERQMQLELKMQKNRESQEESLRRREELIQELELEKERRRQEKEDETNRMTMRREQINAQVEEQRQEQLERECRNAEEEAAEQEALRVQEEMMNREVEKMMEKGYQVKNHGRTRTCWT